MLSGLRLCPQAHQEQEERYEAKLCWMILELPVCPESAGKICEGSSKASLKKQACNGSLLQHFPEDEINCLDSSSEHCCFQLAELFSINITLKSYIYCKKILKKGENSRSIIYKTLQRH